MARKNTNTNTARNTARTVTSAGREIAYTLTHEGGCTHVHMDARATRNVAWWESAPEGSGLANAHVIRAIHACENGTAVKVFDTDGILVGVRDTDGDVRVDVLDGVRADGTDGTASTDGRTANTDGRTARTASTLRVSASAGVPMSTSAWAAREAHEHERIAGTRERMDARIASAREDGAVTLTRTARALRSVSHGARTASTDGTLRTFRVLRTADAPTLAEIRIRNAVDTQVTQERASKAREYRHEHAGESTYGVRPYRVGERIDKRASGRITATACEIAIDFCKYKAQFYPTKNADGERIDSVQAKRAPTGENGRVSAVAVTRGAQDGYAPVAEAMRKVCALMCAMFYAVDEHGNIDFHVDDKGNISRTFDGGLVAYALDHVAQVRAVLVAHNRRKFSNEIGKACKKPLEKMLYALSERMKHVSDYASEHVSDGTLAISAPTPVSDALADYPRLARIVNKYITDEREREIVERVIFTDDSMAEIGKSQKCDKSTISRHFNKSMDTLREHEREILRATRDRSLARHITGTPVQARADDTRSLRALDTDTHERAWWDGTYTSVSRDTERTLKTLAYKVGVRPSAIFADMHA